MPQMPRPLLFAALICSTLVVASVVYAADCKWNNGDTGSSTPGGSCTVSGCTAKIASGTVAFSNTGATPNCVCQTQLTSVRITFSGSCGDCEIDVTFGGVTTSYDIMGTSDLTINLTQSINVCPQVTDVLIQLRCGGNRCHLWSSGNRTCGAGCP